MKFAVVLKELREEQGLSQKELSQKLNISQSAIAKWELCKTEPTAKYLILLSSFFGVSIEYLLGIED